MIGELFCKTANISRKTTPQFNLRTVKFAKNSVTCLEMKDQRLANEIHEDVGFFLWSLLETFLVVGYTRRPLQRAVLEFREGICSLQGGCLRVVLGWSWGGLGVLLQGYPHTKPQIFLYLWDLVAGVRDMMGLMMTVLWFPQMAPLWSRFCDTAG